MLHGQLIAETGGLHGLRDEGLLDSALSAPFSSFGGAEVYPTLAQKAVRLCFGLVKNHPFLDGNKRTDMHAMLVFLALNGIELEYTQEELSDVILSLAAAGRPKTRFSVILGTLYSCLFLCQTLYTVINHSVK